MIYIFEVILCCCKFVFLKNKIRLTAVSEKVIFCKKYWYISIIYAFYFDLKIASFNKYFSESFVVSRYVPNVKKHNICEHS